MNARNLLGLVVVAAGLWTLVAIFRREAKPAAPTQWTSSKQCAECHPTQFAEWKDSWHAQAWTDVEVRKLSNDFSNTDCIDCHAPQPIFDTGIGNRVLPRTSRQIEGVDCITCHLTRDQRVAGTVDNPNVACRPIAQRELISPESCAGCHDQHDTVKQWRASRFAVPGPDFKDCAACHMPPRVGDVPGRMHQMHGGHDIELVRSAVTLKVARVDGKAQFEIENVGAGHNFPTDERSRAGDVFWRPLRDDGAPNPWRHIYRFRSPYRYEVGIENTELASGAKLARTIDDAEASGPLEVALFYKLTPYWTDPSKPDPERESTLVHRARLEP